MTFFLNLLIGAAGGVAFVLFARALGRLEKPLFAGCLLLAALAYVGLGLGARSVSELMLEFGGGCSTLIYAQALADNAAEGAPGFLYSLDADETWGAVTARSVPAHLQTFCEVRITPADPVEFDGTPAWRFRDVPDVAPDFIYLDGPALTPDRKVAVDVLDLEDRFPPGFHLLVDGRSRNCAFLEAHFKRRYDKTHRRVLKSTTYRLLS